jgi:hypothetical protein
MAISTVSFLTFSNFFTLPFYNGLGLCADLRDHDAFNRIPRTYIELKHLLLAKLQRYCAASPFCSALTASSVLH